MTQTFDVIAASLNGEPVQIVSKNQRPERHEIVHDVIDLGERGLNLAVKLPQGLQGEYDLLLKLKVG